MAYEDEPYEPAFLRPVTPPPPPIDTGDGTAVSELDLTDSIFSPNPSTTSLGGVSKGAVAPHGGALLQNADDGSDRDAPMAGSRLMPPAGGRYWSGSLEDVLDDAEAEEEAEAEDEHDDEEEDEDEDEEDDDTDAAPFERQREALSMGLQEDMVKYVRGARMAVEDDEETLEEETVEEDEDEPGAGVVRMASPGVAVEEDEEEEEEEEEDEEEEVSVRGGRFDEVEPGAPGRSESEAALTSEEVSYSHSHPHQNNSLTQGGSEDDYSFSDYVNTSQSEADGRRAAMALVSSQSPMGTPSRLRKGKRKSKSRTKRALSWYRDEWSGTRAGGGGGGSGGGGDSDRTPSPGVSPDAAQMRRLEPGSKPPTNGNHKPRKSIKGKASLSPPRSGRRARKAPGADVGKPPLSPPRRPRERSSGGRPKRSTSRPRKPDPPADKKKSPSPTRTRKKRRSKSMPRAHRLRRSSSASDTTARAHRSRSRGRVVPRGQRTMRTHKNVDAMRRRSKSTARLILSKTARPAATRAIRAARRSAEAAAASAGTGQRNIRVAVRVRPMNERELRDEAFSVVDVDDDMEVVLHDPADIIGAAVQGLGSGGADSDSDAGGANGTPDESPGRLSRRRSSSNIASLIPGAKKPKKQKNTLYRSKTTRFQYDAAFEEDSTSLEVYQVVVKPMIRHIVSGVNSTIFAYGATGSGKTYTMTGTPTHPGIIPAMADDLFLQLDLLDRPELFEVRGFYLEIYNERLRDLLAEDADASSELVSLREDPHHGVMVIGITERVLRTAGDVLEMLREGQRHRSVDSHRLNIESSRSHAVLQMTVRQFAPHGDEVEDEEARRKRKRKGHRRQKRIVLKSAKLSLIDLAGSERVKQTKTGSNKKMRREGAQINKSLLALANCINALAHKTKKGLYVPFRDSKLTRMLKDSLSGDSKTCMIATVSPSSSAWEQTRETLIYAHRAANITSKPKREIKNRVLDVVHYQKMVKKLQTELEQLKNQAAQQLGMPSPRSSRKVEAADAQHYKQLRVRIVDLTQETIQTKRSFAELQQTNQQNAEAIASFEADVMKWKEESGVGDPDNETLDDVDPTIIPHGLHRALRQCKSLRSSMRDNVAFQAVLEARLRALAKDRKHLRRQVSLAATEDLSPDRIELLQMELRMGDLEIQNLDKELEITILRRVIDNQYSLEAGVLVDAVAALTGESAAAHEIAGRLHGKDQQQMQQVEHRMKRAIDRLNQLGAELTPMQSTDFQDVLPPEQESTVDEDAYDEYETF